MPHLRTCRYLLRDTILLVALIVAVRPHVIARTDVRGPGEVPEHPQGRPKTARRRVAGQLRREFDNPPRHAEFVPSLHHARLHVLGIGEVLLLILVEGSVQVGFQFGGDAEGTVGCSDGLGAVVVQSLVRVYASMRERGWGTKNETREKRSKFQHEKSFKATNTHE